MRRGEPSETSPITVCADDLGSQVMALWPRALRRLLEIPGVFVIGAVRREDYIAALAASGVVIESRLTVSSAQAIHQGLIAAGVPVALEVEEPIEVADGLLMEFLALVMTGRRLREVLADQLDRLRTPNRSLDRRALRLVCAAHALGSTIQASTLGARLADGGDVATVGDALATLEGEHLIVHLPTMGSWRGLHDLRSDVILDVLHRSPPPTLDQTYCEVIPLLPAPARPSSE